MIKVDNIIIGAGPAGYELAAELSARGESVVIFERDSLGGTCLNRGCIPTKALCASAKAAVNAKEAAFLGVNVDNVHIDFDRVVNRAKEVVAGLRQGVGQLLGNCTVVHGEAEFKAPRTVAAGENIYEADRVIIATGSKPALLPVEGAGFAITSDDALWLEKLPESVTIVGGGVIGMEFASIFASFGVKVTVIEYLKEILPTVDPEIAKRLRTTLSRRGIDIITGAAVKSIVKCGDVLRTEYEGKKGVGTADSEKVIMAVGRRPVVPKGFEGELTPRGFIKVDDRMQTSVDGVFAIGDVNGLLMLAHAAYAQGRVILHDDSSLFNPDFVPSVVFTMPEVASVGASPSKLDEKGVKTRSVKKLFASNGKACADAHAEGFVKMTVNDDDEIMAVTVMGPQASELIAEATILVTDRIKVGEVASKYIHAHPTLSEIFV